MYKGRNYGLSGTFYHTSRFDYTAAHEDLDQVERALAVPEVRSSQKRKRQWDIITLLAQRQKANGRMANPHLRVQTNSDSLSTLATCWPGLYNKNRSH